MANTSELEKGLNELKRLTGITLAVTAENSDQEQMALEQIRCLCLAYREKYNKNDFLMGLITGGIPSYDVQQRAARLHIAPEEERILFLIEMKEPDEILERSLKIYFLLRQKPISFLFQKSDWLYYIHFMRQRIPKILLMNMQDIWLMRLLTR